MVGLLVVELCEELGGEGSVFTDGSGRGRSMAGGSWGVVGQVGVFRHALSIIDAEGVSAKGGMGLAVFKGLGALLRLSLLQFLAGSGWLEGGVIQVSYRWG